MRVVQDVSSQAESVPVLNAVPGGVALVDDDGRITWANRCLIEWCDQEDLVGKSIYEGFGEPVIIGPEYCPLDMALVTAAESETTIQAGNRFFEIHAAPLNPPVGKAGLVLSISDVTTTVVQQQKLEAIYRAGNELTDLKPDEMCGMSFDQRIDLLKDNIRHFTKHLLSVDVLEIRLLKQATGNLLPLLSVGINQEAADRQLTARPEGNGVTGWVASSGKSYLCRNTKEDKLYLESFDGALSSLTVPLILHDAIIGTMNVESSEANAFDTSDMQFLEIFAREVAVALNTLELLSAEKSSAALESCDQIRIAVMRPIDDILKDCAHLQDELSDANVSIRERIQRVQSNARGIKTSIQAVGESVSTEDVRPAAPPGTHPERLRGTRILVVDADENVVDEAHKLLEKYNCTVEAAVDGEEAILMVKSCSVDSDYDVIISDIRLPDFSGYQLMMKLRDIKQRVPMALMTGFGYDPGHSIVKAREAGLPPKALLYKPFRIEQLLAVIEVVLDQP